MAIQHQITADDWGFSPSINDGILELVQAGWIRRVSLMPTQPYLTYQLDELVATGAELGLHFNLTHPSLKNSIPSGIELQPYRWVFSGKKRLDIAIECLKTQLQILSDHKITISYLDGHHHIHLIPGFIDRSAPFLKQYGIGKIRIPYHSKMLLSARAPIALLALLAKSRADFHQLTYLSFYYPTLRELENTEKLAQFIMNHPDTEILVHPAKRIDDELLREGDPYTQGRIDEYQALLKLSQVKSFL